MPAIHQLKGFTLRKLAITAVMALAVLSLSSTAHAEPVQEVNFQIKDVSKDGRYTIVFGANAYDTTGAPPPLVTTNQIRLPSGVRIRREFLRTDYQCKVADVRDALVTPDGARSYTSRLNNLQASLKRTRKKLKPGIVRGVEKCIGAQIGKGRVKADVRPTFPDPADANLFLYLAKPNKKGAKAAIGVLVVLNEKGIFVKNNPFFATLRLTFLINVFDETSPDGKLGYRLDLPGGGAAGVRVSLAEVSVTTPGITRVTRKVKCLRKNKKRRCVKRKVTTQKLFWLTKPTCPATGQLGFNAFYQYETGLTSTLNAQIPCPRFTT